MAISIIRISIIIRMIVMIITCINIITRTNIITIINSIMFMITTSNILKIVATMNIPLVLDLWYLQGLMCSLVSCM